MSNVLEVILNLVDNLTSGMNAPTESVDELANSAQNASNAIDNMDSKQISDVSASAKDASTNLEGAATAASTADTSIDGINDTTLNEAASSASALGSDLSAMGTEAAGAAVDVAGIDSGNLDSVETSAKGAASDLGSVGTEAAGASSSLGGLDAGAIQEAASHASALGSSLSEVAKDGKEASNSVSATASSASDLDTVVAGVTSLGLAAWMEQAVASAGNLNDTWERLGDAMGQGAMTADQVKAAWSGAVSTMQSATGRSAGVIRNYLITMGLAGVTNAQTLETAFTGISGAAFVTGNSIDTIESAFARVVRTGTFSARQLTSLGLTTQDVQKATGLSVDEVSSKLSGMDTNARAAYLSMILNAKYGTDANNDYKNSWQHVTDELGVAYSYLQRIFGGLILPIAIPAIELASSLLSGLADYIDGLNGPAKTILGIILTLGTAFVILAGAIKILKAAWSALQIVSLLTNPVALAIIAIILLVAAIYEVGKALGWWNNLGEMGQAVMARLTTAWNDIVGVCQAVYLALLSVYNALLYVNACINNFVTTVGNAITSTIAWVASIPGKIWSYLMSIIMRVAQFFLQLWAKAGEGGRTGLNQVAFFIGELIGTVVGFFVNIITTIYTYLLLIWTTVTTWLIQLPGTIWNYLMLVINYVISFAINMYNQAVSAGSNFVNGFISFIAGLPGALWNYLMYCIQQVGNYARAIRAYAEQAGRNLVNGFIGNITSLPGRVGQIMWNIVQKIIGFGGQAYNAAVQMAQNIWNGFKSGLGIHSPSYLEKAMDAIIEKAQEMPNEFGNVANKLAGVNWKQGNPEMDLTSSLTAATASEQSMEVHTTHDLNVNVDLANVPEGTDTGTLKSVIKSALKDSDVLKTIAKDDTFRATFNSEMGKGTIRTRRAKGGSA